MSQAQDNASEEEPKKKSKLKLIIIIVAALLIIGGGAAAYFFLGNPFGSSEEDSAVTTATTPAPAGASAIDPSTTQAPAPTQLPATYLTSIQPLTINLADIDITRYLRISIDVELSTQDSINQLQANNAKIRDAIIILLSSKKYENISTASGKLQIKNEIISRINQILGVPRVVQIYFTDFVVQ